MNRNPLALIAYAKELYRGSEADKLVIDSGALRSLVKLAEDSRRYKVAAANQRALNREARRSSPSSPSIQEGG